MIMIRGSVIIVVLASSLLLASCGESRGQTTVAQNQPGAVEPGERTTEIPATPTIIDDTGTLLTVPYQSRQFGVFVTKSFTQAMNGLPKVVTAGQDTPGMLNNQDFFVQPHLMVTSQQVRAALKGKMLVNLPGDRKGRDPQYEVKLQVNLLPDDLRATVANAINSAYLKATVKAEQVNLVPFDYIELWADIGVDESREVLVAAIPRPVGAAQPKNPPALPGTIPTILDVSLRGTETQLEQFAVSPRMRLRLVLGGFSVIQDVLQLSLGRFASSGLYQLLTGRAAWELTYKQTELVNRLSAAGGVNLGVVDLSGRNELKAGVKSDNVEISSWVTRQQIRDLVQAYTSVSQLMMWEETRKGFDDATKRAFLKMLVDRAVETRPVPLILNDQKRFVIDMNRVGRDIEATSITNINASVKNVSSVPVAEAPGGDKGGGPAAKKQKPADDAGPKGRPGKEGDTFTDEDGITWAVAGKLWLPKSVEVYQFNSACFVNVQTASAVRLVAKRERGLFEVENTAQTRLRAVRVCLHTHANGNAKPEQGSIEVVLRHGDEEIARKADIGKGKRWNDGYKEPDSEVVLNIPKAVILDGKTPLELEVRVTGGEIYWRPVLRVDGWVHGDKYLVKDPSRPAVLPIAPPYVSPTLQGENKQSKLRGNNPEQAAVWKLNFTW